MWSVIVAHLQWIMITLVLKHLDVWMTADVAETYTVSKYKWVRKHLHVWVWCLFCIEAKAYTVSYSWKVLRQAKHLCLSLIDCLSLKHWLLLHSVTLPYYSYLDSCFASQMLLERKSYWVKVVNNTKRHWLLSILPSNSFILPHKHSLVSLHLCLKSSLLFGVSVPFSNMWALCQLLSLLHKWNKSLLC